MTQHNDRLIIRVQHPNPPDRGKRSKECVGRGKAKRMWIECSHRSLTLHQPVHRPHP